MAVIDAKAHLDINLLHTCNQYAFRLAVSTGWQVQLLSIKCKIRCQKDEMGDRRQSRFRCSVTQPQIEMITLSVAQTTTSLCPIMHQHNWPH